MTGKHTSIKKRLIVSISIAALLIVSIAGAVTVKKFLNHEYNQNNRIVALEDRITVFERRLDEFTKDTDSIFPDAGG